MTGIVIAAGSGLRMWPYTMTRPKCMLPINGRSLLSYTLRSLREAGCRDIVIVTGHHASAIDAPGCAKVHNADYADNNVLHSLMCARSAFDDDLLVTYSDIFVEPHLYRDLAAAPGEIVIAVDRDWLGYYEGRTAHPVSEAEKAYVRAAGACGRLTAIGKHLDPSGAGEDLCGEFLGLWKMTQAGARRFRERFEEIDARLTPTDPFGTAGEWRKAYVTDLLGDLVSAGVEISCVLLDRGWAEFDAAQDYERLRTVIGRQRLVSLDHQS